MTAVGVSQQILVMVMEAGAAMQMDAMLVLNSETTGARFLVRNWEKYVYVVGLDFMQV